ncbi:MAG TPA: MFS transporter, partial [Methylomirabilota bacterium]|nr:MFS transporter [Methylomirabilota bacterium]
MEELHPVVIPTVAVARPKPWTVFASGNFRKLWVGTTLSLFGDFFSYIAIAWLVLQLTGSSLALGSVLVAQAL